MTLCLRGECFRKLITSFQVGDVRIGSGDLFLIAGPCVIESEEHAIRMAEIIKGVARSLDLPFIFKASYDKANRTSIRSFRGPGIKDGLRISGSTPDGTYVEMVELPDHPHFIGCQFHPEFKSKPLEPHPLFQTFVGAAYAKLPSFSRQGHAPRRIVPPKSSMPFSSRNL